MGRIAFDIVIFDLDGTLVDSVADLAAALNHALLGLGREPLSEDAVRGMVGRGARTLLARGLAATGEVSDTLVDAAMPLFLDHYERHIADHSLPYPGVEQALQALKAADVTLAICTNKPEALARKLIAALGWEDRFSTIIGGDTLATRKPDPAPVREAIARAGGGPAAFVGDSVSDTQAAAAAGLPCVALTFGYSDRPADELGASILIDHFDDLLPALERLG